MKHTLVRNSAVLMIGLALSGAVFAKEVKAKTAGAAATVNGTVIADKTLEKIIKNNVAQGQKDTPELRKVILDELIARELFTQEATKLGLDKTAEAQEQLMMIKNNFLIDLLVANYLQKNPITDSDLKKEYDSQIAAIGDAQEYNLKQIVVSSEADAKAVIASLKKGESFEKLAKDKSIDGSKEQGGNLGWVLSKQIIPEIANVIANLAKGGVTSSPIQTNAGWHVVKVEDMRAFKAPSLEDSKPRIRQGLVQNKRIELLNKLRESAKIAQ